MLSSGKETVTFAIIGCGDVTEVKSGPALQKVRGSALKTVMRRDPAKLRDYALRHHVEHYTTDYLEIMNDPEIDAVYIATPPDTHCFYTLEAAKYGKAVYVEKPMARTADECRQMIAACAAAGVPLFTAYYRRGHEKFNTIRKLVSDGTLGEVRAFSYQFSCPAPADEPASWRMNPAVSGGGLLYDVGSHMVDTLRFMLGEVGTACALSKNSGGKYTVNDLHSIALRFVSGVQGTMQLTFCVANQRDEGVLVGSKGYIRFSIMDNGPITLSTPEGAEEIAFAPMEHVQQALITRVVNTLLGHDDLDSTGSSALITQEILDAVDSGRPYEGGNGAQRA